MANRKAWMIFLTLLIIGISILDWLVPQFPAIDILEAIFESITIASALLAWFIASTSKGGRS